MTATLALASLFLAGSFGGLYLLLLSSIRNRSFGLLFRGLPDLETLARLNRRAASVGFILLTIGINLGIWWAHSGAVPKLDYLDAKVLPWLVLWAVFGLVAVSRALRLLSDRRIAWLSFACATVMMLLLGAAFLPIGVIHRS
jgi:ABC-type transport system involved in cytochrome c biogenesis permease subunit